MHEKILITGCSTGIGRSTALCSHGRGHTVIATARRPETLDGLPDDIVKLQLDVCDTGSVDRAIAEANERCGAITAVVNNAGYGQAGPVECVTEEQVRAQFDTNVEGPLRVIRAVLPQMREGGHGTIVNVSSAAGRFSTPFLGVYCASKFALEALSDALRIEVEPFGVRVVIIEPGPITTNFGEIALGSTEATILDDPDNPYHRRATRAATIDDALERFFKSPSDVAKVIVASIEARSPRARRTITLPAKMGAVTAMFPTVLIDHLLRRVLDK